ncbi:aminopeptidase N [Canibacter sp. lx-45]|uniref:aminopeptidase N n=1 Tax=Canibacter zhuwentaonis TaxID=2837491 RepID=UPI001BDBBDD8|nr:aminopeptidase N [Canibacter zhuwentaonis]MBT1035075.1 aminopeptidase N [Canibacter zhuwentaonis]
MPGTNLTRAEARTRAELLRVESYDIKLDLARGEKQFGSDTTVRFSAAETGSSSFISLIADSVESVELNDVQLDPATVYQDSRVLLENLQKENVLRVVSTQAYTNTGEGMHRFVDPVDGEVYLYTQFEVPDSRRVFTVFEQPDLKAKFKFTVTAPANWLIVGNQPTPEPVDAGISELGNGKPNTPIATWSFEPTPVMSSYITAIIAGPYKGKRSELTNSEGRTIPLGVFCRASLEAHLDADYIIEKTRQGFEFFEREFNFPYPFAKYDQVFVPEFNMGAMENIGAVTHTEAYVFRGKTEEAVKERRVVTVLHELAHMWFGDLVTMKWWNDLWLNESFAEYTSVLATAEATEYTDSWTTFASHEKSWAYRQDQLPSTHPVVAEILDLEDVMSNFDGITYAKGAAVLKALVAYVGRKDFFLGVSEYFRKHQYKNTELPDLLQELELTSGRDLNTWSQAWLETAGVNTLSARFELDLAGNYKSFEVVQSAHEKYPTIRPHRVAIGCYNVVNGRLERTAQVETDIAESVTEIAELVGAAQPDLLLLNDDDLTFAKVRFDERSLQTAKEYLGSCEDSLARAVIWGVLWDTTRDGELPASEFVKTVLANISGETQSSTLRTVLGQLHTALSIYTAPENRNALTSVVAIKLLELAEQAAAGSDSQFQLVKAFAEVAASKTHLATVADLHSGKKQLAGLEVDTDLAWAFLISLVAGGAAGESEIAAALAADNTASGNQAAAKARAAIPTAAGKAAAWKDNVLSGEVPNLIVRSSGAGFQRVHNPELLAPYAKEFFKELNTLWEQRSFAIAEEIIDSYYPLPLANAKLEREAAAWLAANTNAPRALRRFILEAHSDTARALRAQQADGAVLNS